MWPPWRCQMIGMYIKKQNRCKHRSSNGTHAQKLKRESPSVKLLTCWKFHWRKFRAFWDNLNMLQIAIKFMPYLQSEKQLENHCQHKPTPSRHTWKRPTIPFEENYRQWDVGLSAWPRKPSKWWSPCPKTTKQFCSNVKSISTIFFNIINFFHKDKLEPTLINSHLMASAGKCAVQITWEVKFRKTDVSTITTNLFTALPLHE